EPGRIYYLEAFFFVIRWTIVKYCGHGVKILPSVLPKIDSSIGSDTSWVIDAGKPMHRVDLMGHPLAGNARGVGPKQPVLQIFPWIPSFVGAVHEQTFPFGIVLPDLFRQLRQYPPARLVDVPIHFYHYNVAEFTRADIVIGCMVIGCTSPLGSYLDDFSRSFYRFPCSAVIFHGFGKGFFHIHIPACFHGFLTHKGMLEICCADNNRIDVLSVIEFLVVPGISNVMAGLSFKIGYRFIPTSLPDI